MDSRSSADLKNNIAYYLNHTNIFPANRPYYCVTKDNLQNASVADTSIAKDKLIPPVATNVPGKK